MAKRITRFLALVAFVIVFGSLESQTLKWNPAGPIYTAGRARNMVVDKNDASGNTLYVGSTSSGIFKSTDAGSNWVPLNDTGYVRNISYMAQDKNGSIWVGTGEGFLRFGQKAKAQRGTGLYILQNNSLIKKQDSSVIGRVINRIACDPSNAQRIALSTNTGIWVSVDGGATFYKPTGPAALSHSLITGLDVKFDSNGLLYCSAGSELAYSGYNMVPSRVYKSDAALTLLNDITPTNSSLSDSNYGRIELAIAPTDNNVIYVSCAAKSTDNPTTSIPGSRSSAVLKALFVSYDAGTNWGLITFGPSPIDPLSNGATLASGDYAHVLLVSPNNPKQLFIGSYQFAVFTRTGGTDNTPIGTWAQPSIYTNPKSPRYIHENIHDIKLVPGNPTKFYFITDAGIYRSTDMTSASQTVPPSFQPFYRGLITGQFNSVTMERYPIAAGSGTTATAGQSVTPYTGFVGGTGGNGANYYSGTYSLASSEISWLGGEVYNVEFSRILDGAAFMTTSSGGIFRSSNVKSNSPTLVNRNRYTGGASVTAPHADAFENGGFTTGSPFRLWENYGQVKPAPDSIVFYNDSLRFQYSMSGLATLTTQTNFTFSAARPNKFALIDSIVVRTGTVSIPLSTSSSLSPTPFTGNDLQDISVKLQNNYVANPNSNTNPPVSKVTGPSSTAYPPSVTLNPILQLDNISVTFSAPPFASKTQTFSNVPDASAYYRVFATVFYKYKKNDSVTVIDDNISTQTTVYAAVLPQNLYWSRTNTGSNSSPTGPKTQVNPPSTVNKATNPVHKIAAFRSARLAVILKDNAITNNSKLPNQYAIVVSKAPLALNDPLNFVRVSQSGCWTDNASGAPTTNTIDIPGKPVLLEWSKGGTEIYYATDDKKLYRVSHITDIMDLSPSSYNGKFYSDVFSYSSPINSNTLNPNSSYRTTLIGTFTNAITSINVSKDDSRLVITLNNTGSGPVVVYNTNSAKVSDISNIGWVTKATASDLAFKGVNTYCSLMEKTDNKKVFVGTDYGIAYTSDITAATPDWKNVNEVSTSQLPRVQVFDLEQQLMEPMDCYNSGQIYVATNGRGVWTTSSFHLTTYVDVKDFEKETSSNSLSIFPNPSNGNSVNVKFNGIEGETAIVNVMDISGRIVKSENIGKLNSNEVIHILNLNELSTGIYIIKVESSSGLNRTGKLIVAK